MDMVRYKQTTKTNGEKDLVEIRLTSELPNMDSIRVGLESGMLKKATFKLYSGQTVIYEKAEE